MTRAELYEMIWKEPMSRVAARLGINSVTLRRICDRHDIPRPRPGHWSKLAYGKAVDRLPLSAARFDRLHKVRIPAADDVPSRLSAFLAFACLFHLAIET